MTFQTNYLAPFLLQSLLHDRLSASRARVIVTSSAAHRIGRIELDDLEFSRRSYSAFPVYGAAKLADLIFAREIARRTADTGITGVAFHPGLVKSSFAGDAKGLTGLVYRTGLVGLVSINNAAGAAPLVHLASIPDATVVNGQYFNRLKGDADDVEAGQVIPNLPEQLWAATEAMLDLPSASIPEECHRPIGLSDRRPSGACSTNPCAAANSTACSTSTTAPANFAPTHSPASIRAPRRSAPVTSSRSVRAPIRSAPRRSQPEMLAPTRFASRIRRPDRSVPVSFAPANDTSVRSQSRMVSGSIRQSVKVEPVSRQPVSDAPCSAARSNVQDANELDWWLLP